MSSDQPLAPLSLSSQPYASNHPLKPNSCFPIVPKLACRHLDLPITSSPKPLTLLGGLTSFGGAGNNYSMHVSQLDPSSPFLSSYLHTPSYRTTKQQPLTSDILSFLQKGHNRNDSPTPPIIAFFIPSKRPHSRKWRLADLSTRNLSVNSTQSKRVFPLSTEEPSSRDPRVRPNLIL